MNINEKYFISLINSHLNCTAPKAPENVEWNKIYELAAINNITGIIAAEIKKLDKINHPDSKIMSAFSQQLGYTLIDFTEKEKAVSTIRNILNDNKINHIFVKGEIIKKYYPIKELRTSADTDIIIRYDDLEKLRNILKKLNINTEYNTSTGFTINMFNQNIEIHSTLDYDNEYFVNIFELSNNGEYECVLDNYHQLLYILCHIIKHFRYCGAGIKMFMDIDVLIRHTDNFNYEKLLDMCRNIGIEMFMKCALSLCNYLFDTPVKAEIDFEKDTKFKELFEDEIINGGSFGFSKRNADNHHFSILVENGKMSKLKAFFVLLFPNARYLKSQFAYAEKHSILLPLAWLHRLFIGVFKRGRHSAETISSIAASSGNENYIQLLKELKI